jgi:hypothetical protein
MRERLIGDSAAATPQQCGRDFDARGSFVKALPMKESAASVNRKRICVTLSSASDQPSTRTPKATASPISSGESWPTSTR